METQLPENLLDRLREGDHQAMKWLFGHFHPQVCRVIQGYVGNRQQTLDLAQRVFIRLWEKREQLDIRTSLEGYLRRMAVNEAVYFLRRARQFEEEAVLERLPDTVFYSAENQLAGKELKTRIDQAIRDLPPKTRTVFLLSRFEELTYAEIAAEMGISVKTVENQMVRALRMLRDRLRPYLNDHGGLKG